MHVSWNILLWNKTVGQFLQFLYWPIRNHTIGSLILTY